MIKFFASAGAWREWLRENHDKERELWVGYHKKGSGRASVTWPESVDEALCFGWIDGVRYSIDERSYKIRFTPRKVGSNWSVGNVRRVGELIEMERMHAAGMRAFEARDRAKVAQYSYERASAKLSAEQVKRFKADKAAWEWFQKSPPHYRKAAILWVATAKKEETRQRRLETLIEDSANGRWIAPMAPRRAPVKGRRGGVRGIPGGL